MMLAMRLVGVLVTTAIAVGCNDLQVRAERDLTLHVPWDRFDALAVRSSNGGIDVSTGDGDVASISGTLAVAGATREEAEARLARLDVSAAADPAAPTRLLVEFRVPDDLRSANPSAKLVIKVPQAVPTDVQTTNGAIVVQGMSGLVRLRTSNGSLTARGIDGPVNAQTSNGAVIVADTRGDVEAVTSNGRIEAVGVSGACKAQTSNGAITIRATGGGVRAVSSNGAINVDAEPAPDAPVTLKTSNAPISLTLPKALAGELSLLTNNGTARAALEGLRATVTTQSRKELRATLNGGGPSRVSVESSNGSINVEFR